MPAYYKKYAIVLDEVQESLLHVISTRHGLLFAMNACDNLVECLRHNLEPTPRRSMLQIRFEAPQLFLQQRNMD